jgi:L-erythro-3,5-diaminohexanoate dehydrogenase
MAADRSRAALDDLRRIGAVDDAVEVDATDAVGTMERLGRAGPPFDLVINACSVPGTELSSVLAARSGGTVVYFSMATSFTAAALGAEGVGKDVTMLMGNGYVPGHAELTLDLLRRLPRLRALFEQRYVR